MAEGAEEGGGDGGVAVVDKEGRVRDCTHFAFQLSERKNEMRERVKSQNSVNNKLKGKLFVTEILLSLIWGNN